MKPEVVARLLELNHQFYQSFAGPFSETRRRLQPGVTRLLERIPPEASILDLGCGNGTLAATLAQNGWRGPYLGLDSSDELLEAAREALRRLETSGPKASAFGGRRGAVGRTPSSASTARRQETSESHDSSRGAATPSLSEVDAPSRWAASPSFTFRHADLAEPDWVQILPSDPFDIILAFAVLHHLPGADHRLRLGRQLREHIAPEGQFLLSNWQFLNSPRLRDRIQPWGQAGIGPEDVEPDDYLLDWQRGGSGLRYVHHFSPDELQSLAERSGFSVQETFYSDGDGGRLGLYQAWTPG